MRDISHFLCVQFLDLCVKFWEKSGIVLKNVSKQLKKILIVSEIFFHKNVIFHMHVSGVVEEFCCK